MPVRIHSVTKTGPSTKYLKLSGLWSFPPCYFLPEWNTGINTVNKTLLWSHHTRLLKTFKIPPPYPSIKVQIKTTIKIWIRNSLSKENLQYKLANIWISPAQNTTMLPAQSTYSTYIQPVPLNGTKQLHW
jgi:hypothetical protein